MSRATEEIVVPCDTNCLETVRGFVRRQAGASGLSQSDIGRLVLAVDEASSNILEHTYHFDWHHKLTVIWHHGKEQIVVELRDDSPVSYLPSNVDFDLSTKIKYRHATGYGKYLIRRCVDDVQYETVPGAYNRVLLVKFLEGAARSDKTDHLFVNPYDRIHRRSVVLQSLLDVWGKIDSGKDPDEMTRLFLYTIAGLLTSHPVALLWARKKTDPFELAGQVGLSKRVSGELRLAREGWVSETLWAQKGPVLADTFRKLKNPSGEIEVLERLRASVLVPVFLFKGLSGIVTLGRKKNGRPFSDEDIAVITLLASHLLLLIGTLDGTPLLKETAREKGGFREAARSAITALIHASVSQKISFDLQEGAASPDLPIEISDLRKVLVSLFTHVLYLAQSESPIQVRLQNGDGQSALLMEYAGRPLSFEKGKEGYNLVIDQLLAGSPKLLECRRVIERAGGKIVIAPAQKKGETVSLRITLPTTK